jgi:single-strand DNA-binding protein
MAGSVNKVILIGHLGAKPELKYLPSGQAVCEMRIATSEVFNDKQNQRQERTEWHSIVAWGKTGENCAQYLDKGRQIYVEGRLQTRSWDDKNSGEKRYKTEIVANQVTFLGSGAGGGGGEGGGGGYGGPRGGGGGPRGGGGGPRGGGGDPSSGGDFPPPSDDDIPF